MVNLLSKDQLRIMSPEGRIKNSYESLYYRANSGDPEADEILRLEMQTSFKEHDVVLSDKPKPERLRQVMIHAVGESTKELQRAPLTPEQSESITQSFDTVSARARFYETVFSSVESRHRGEPVDFSAEYERMIKDNPTHEMELSEEVMNAMEAEFINRDNEERKRDEIGGRVPRTPLAPTVLNPAALSAPKPGDEIPKVPVHAAKTPRAGLSYVAHVPEAVAPVRTPVYAHAAQDEAMTRDQKRKFDRGGSAMRYTVEDEFGFDEKDDDGPEL